MMVFPTPVRSPLPYMNLFSTSQSYQSPSCSIPQNPSTLSEIQRLADEGDEVTLTALLGSRMAFGTAGAQQM